MSTQTHKQTKKQAARDPQTLDPTKKHTQTSKRGNAYSKIHVRGTNKQANEHTNTNDQTHDQTHTRTCEHTRTQNQADTNANKQKLTIRKAHKHKLASEDGQPHTRTKEQMSARTSKQLDKSTNGPAITQMHLQTKTNCRTIKPIKQACQHTDKHTRTRAIK